MFTSDLVLEPIPPINRPLYHKGMMFSFLLFSVAGLYAQSKSGEFRLSAYNDSWGGGFTEVYDDLRTCHFELNYARRNRLQIFARYSLLTNRFDADTLQKKALDEFILNGAYSLYRFKGKGGAVRIRAGILATGNSAGLIIQQIAHEVFNVPQNKMEYYSLRGVYPTIGYEIDKVIADKSVRVRLDHDLTHHVGYRTSVGIGVSFGLLDSRVVMNAGYRYMKNHLSGNSLLNKVSYAESGPTLGMKVFGKHIYYHFALYPAHHFSYGGIGIRLYRADSASKVSLNSRWVPDIEVSVLSGRYGYNFKYAFLSFPVLNRSVGVLVNHNFHSLLRSWMSSFKTNGNANQITAGLEMNLLKTKTKPRIFDPFVNITAGDKAIAVYSQVLDIAKQTSHHLVLCQDAGIRVNVPLKLAAKQLPFSLVLYHRLMLLKSLTPSKESPWVNEVNNPYAPVQHAYGLGIRISL